MHAIRSLILLVSLSFLTSGAAVAQVNYGDFLGNDVDFLQVTEDTQTVGDPAVMWGAPALSGTGNGLTFAPPAFLSSCANGGADTTTSFLTTTIEALPGKHLTELMLVEGGDVTLTQFPPFGAPDTNATASVGGFLTVTETTAGPIAPVAIPVTGTFTPSATFALPTDFGTNGWTGSILIDIAAVVPLATKAELQLDNTLEANCGAGASSANIQKKAVSGPAMTLLMNPLACDIDIDKTCCAPQPILPELDSCEGDVIRMVMEYTGDKCSASDNEQGKKFRCYGKRELGDPASITILDPKYGPPSTTVATPSSGIDIGDIVEFTDTSGALANRTKWKTTDPYSRRQYIKMDTSCDRAIECGDQFGAYKLVGLETTLGGYVDCSAPPPDPSCDTGGDPIGTLCDAKVVDMVLEYTGQACQMPLPNPQSGSAYCTGDATGAVNINVLYVGNHPNRETISPSSGINDGDRIRVTSTHNSGMFPNQEYLITDSAGILQEIGFHTSCSQPLALGDEFGSFKVVEFTTKNGTTVKLGPPGDGTADQCEVPLVPPKPHCTDTLESITLAYIDDFLGEGCTVSNDQSGYAYCTGSDAPGEPIDVTFPDPGLTGTPDEMIEFGDLMTITDDSGELPWFVEVDTWGDSTFQRIGFKASCHKPLSLGDRFGAWVVYGMDRKNDGPITLGGEIQYQYTVSNPNTGTLENVEIHDDQLGPIATGVTLLPGEEQTFTETATLLGTTTNVATATGDVGGNLCLPATDQVTVDVVVPPKGSFECSCLTQMNEVKMIWNGAGAIDVKMWDGPPSGTPLGTTYNIPPGSIATGSGFTKNYSMWEIFQAGTPIRLGYSIFHLTCRDTGMNGVEDCGKAAGDGRYDDPQYINDWIVEGFSDDDETMSCTPISVPGPPECGFGPELMLLLPGLMLLHRRRLNRKE